MENAQAEAKQEKEEKPVRNTIIIVGGEALDFSKLPPFNLGIKRKLFKDTKLDLHGIHKFNPEEEFQFILFVVRLLRKDTTEAEVEALDLGRVMEIAWAAADASQGADRPFSTPSPTSPGGTVGGQPN